MIKQKLNLALIMGGPSPEHEVSLNTGKVILKSLDKRKYRITPIRITKKETWIFPEGIKLNTAEALRRLKTLKTDVVFIAMHGAYGEDGTIQKLLDRALIPYTGSGAKASRLAMDKTLSNKLFTNNGLVIPKSLVISKKGFKSEKTRERILKTFSLPIVVKPSNAGSSVGVTIIKGASGLASALSKASQLGEKILIQEFINGREITCAVLDHGRGKNAFALPPTLIVPKMSQFFDYKAKYAVGGSEEITPAPLPQTLKQRMQKTALLTHKIIGCSGMSRTDMILSKNKLYVLEINTIPGMTKTSLLPKAAKTAGIPFSRLLNLIIAASN